MGGLPPDSAVLDAAKRRLGVRRAEMVNGEDPALQFATDTLRVLQ